MTDVMARALLVTARPPTAAAVNIVLPVFNEAADLATSLDRLRAYLTARFPFTWLITIADNASTDGTAEIAAELGRRFPDVEFLHLDQKGRGRALRTTWAQSASPVVAYMDIDLSTDLDALLPMVAPLASGHSDIAIGSRLLAGASVARGPKRELISRCYNLMLRAMFATQVRDMQCGFKAARTEVVRELLPAVEDQGWFFDTELLLLAERNGLRIHQVPVDWVDDPDSRVNIGQTVRDDLRGALRIAWTFATGGGHVALTHPRAAPDDDFGRRLVTFGAIGVVSTVASLLIFLALRATIGAIAANAIAVTATAAANTWLNARFTDRAVRPRWRRATGISLSALALTSGALLVVGSIGGGPIAEVAALCVTWAFASVLRFLLLNRTIPTKQVP